MQSFKMRRLTLKDVPALSFIAKQTFYDTFTGTCTEADMQYFLNTFYNETVLAEEVNNSNYQYYFAEVADEVVGYILFAPTTTNFEILQQGNTMELKRLYVAAPHHGTGVAQKMMQFLIDAANTHGYKHIILGVWEHNIRAQKFYSKFGFQRTPYTHDFPIGNTPQTDVYMLLTLQP